MANVRITWNNPTSRVDGRPIAPDQIAAVIVEMSADQGANWTEIYRGTGEVADVTDVEPGSYQFRAVVEDTQSPPKQSAYATGSISVEEAAPNAVSNFTVALV